MTSAACPPTPYTHFVFDFDGTLVDSLGTKVNNAALVFSDAFGVDSAEVIRRYYFHSGVARRVLFDRIAQDLLARSLADAEYLQLDARFTRLNLERAGNSPPQANVHTVLTQLASRGARMAISSSAPGPDLLPRVHSSGLERFFDEVLASRDGFRKGPDHIAHLEGSWHTHRTRFLFVGDEAADAHLAARAGVDCALVTHTLHRDEAALAQPLHVLTDFSDVLLLRSRST